MSSSKPQYVILERNPSPQNYHDLRKAANLTPPPMQSVAQSLAGSYVFFTAYEREHMLDDNTPSPDQDAVAMGRLIGDGALFLMLVDMAVHPDHQRRGLGKQIIKGLVDYVDAHAPHAYVSLVGEPLGQRLYAQYGFEDVQPSIGMYRCLPIQNNREFKKAREARAAAMMRGPGERS